MNRPSSQGIIFIAIAVVFLGISFRYYLKTEGKLIIWRYGYKMQEKQLSQMNSFPIEAECINFVNADDLIAQGLSPFQPSKMAIEAGRLMI